MLTIRVTAFHGQPPGQALAAEFDETGGTIGRATTNQLVLPDPERHISRQHAKIAFRNGQYIVIDQGSANPIQLNGRTLGNGVEAPLKDGDELRIGDYALKVAEAKAQAPALGVEPGFFGAPQPGAAAAAGSPVDDPLALFGAGAVPAGDPFADLIAPARAPLTPPPAPPAFENKPAKDIPSPRTPMPAAPAPGVIPEDFDPFADQFAARPLSAEPAPPAKLPEDFDLALGPQPSGGQNIDALFGLAPSGAPASNLFGPGSALGEPQSQPNTAAASDPFAAFGLSQPATPAPASDHVPELHGSFTPPAARAEPAVPPAPSGVAPDKAADAGMFLSWDEGAVPAQAPRTTNQARPPAAPQIPSTEMRAPQPERPRVDAKIGTGAPARESRPAPPSAAQAIASAGGDEILGAFLRGLGTPELKLPHGVTPETMQLVGMMLRQAVQGTIDLLLARAMTKREIRAEVTMIVGRENNPLKFSPDAGVALAHLLNPPPRGFMPPVAAMQDAYDDLRSHTFGFMAGMRAALAGVLARFDPHNLERRLTQKSMLDSLLPMNRRAKLWDLFSEMYHEISKEAEEDFHTLFGREFLRAYEEQVARLREQAPKK
jgi:FHA domain-containing protein